MSAYPGTVPNFPPWPQPRTLPFVGPSPAWATGPAANARTLAPAAMPSPTVAVAGAGTGLGATAGTETWGGLGAGAGAEAEAGFAAGTETASACNPNFVFTCQSTHRAIQDD